VRVQVVEHHADRARRGEVDIDQVTQGIGAVYLGAALRHLNVAPALQGREEHEQVGDPVTDVLIVLVGVVARSPGRAGRGARVSPTNCLLASSMQTKGTSGSSGSMYTSKTSSIWATKAPLACGGMHQQSFSHGCNSFF